MKKCYALVAILFLLCSYAQEQPKKTIILSFNVLFQTNEKMIEKHARSSLSLGTSIGLLFSGIPSKKEMRDELFSVLPHVPLAKISIDPASWKTSYIPWDDTYPFPPILNQMITSSTRQQEKAIYSNVITHIQHNRHIKKQHVTILKSIADFLFQSEWMNKAMEPVASVINLVKKLQHDKYNVILTAGVPGQAWDDFVHNYPQAKIISKLFTPDHIFVSGKENLVPTSEKFYEKILKKYPLDHKNYVVIAQNKHDLAYPKKIGMPTIVYNPQKDSFKTFSQKLMNTLENR